MTTEDLVRALAADRYTGQKPRTALLLALAPAMAVVVILFFPRIGIHMVAVLLPEAGFVGGDQVDAAQPFGAFPEV